MVTMVTELVNIILIVHDLRRCPMVTKKTHKKACHIRYIWIFVYNKNNSPFFDIPYKINSTTVKMI
jgi:hypothetical protein